VVWPLLCLFNFLSFLFFRLFMLKNKTKHYHTNIIILSGNICVTLSLLVIGGNGFSDSFS